MRPIKLTMQAFGPFKDKITIPFENLGNNNIYLISGATGSGKTTIFDAICYALFNTSSGTLRGNQTLRSHFANEDTISYVEFDFIFNNELYSILRHPSYERKKARGEGYIIEQAKAQITLPNGKIIEKLKDVDDYIKELLGLDAAQFSQIALLAQGEFLKLLNSDTQTRGEIFRNIFKTWNYANFQNKLKDETQNYKNIYQNLENSILQYIMGIVAIDENLSLLCQKYNDTKCFNNLDEFIFLLENQNKIDNNNLIQIQKNIEELEKNIEKSQTNFQIIQNKINILKQKEDLKNQETCLNDEFKKIQIEYNKKSEYEKEIQNILLEIQKNEENHQKSIKIKELTILKEKAENEFKLKTNDLDKIKNNIETLKLSHIKQISNEYNSLIEKRDEEQKTFKNLQQEIFKLTNDYNLKYNNYLEIQAGIIAKTLKTGYPCPVCGSLEHPNIAKIENENLTKEYIDNLKNELDEQNKKLIKLSQDCSSLNEKAASKLKEFNQFSKKYSINIEKIKYDILHEDYENIILDNEKSIEKLNNEINTLKNEITSFNSKITAIKDGANISDVDVILKLHETLNYKLNTKKKFLEEVENNYNQKNIELNSTKSKIKLLNEQLKTYKSTKTDTKTIDSIKNQITDFKNKIDFFDKEIEILISRKSINEKNLNSIIQKSKEFDKISKIYGDYKILSDCANGNLKGKARIAFEQYIQSYYLDLVLFEANKRLKIMTQNQFQLLRKQDVTSYQSKIGLDIEVMDFHTFKKRSTKTLSGGESFKTALALALGLSDCVSNFSGTINMDAMFIDEGFGTLDAESLETALNVIFELSAANRLVGIISHIDELKLRIPNQIITYKTQNGSFLEINF